MLLIIDNGGTLKRGSFKGWVAFFVNRKYTSIHQSRALMHTGIDIDVYSYNANLQNRSPYIMR